jgi:hypothetical protein
MFLLAVTGLALAVEGMWEPAQIPAQEARLRQTGFEGDAAALARLDQAPLGAVVSLGFCTASFVSPDGLAVTNQHCAVGFAQQASGEGEDLVDNGFLASTRAEERSVGPGGRIFLTTEIRDVTAEMTGKLPKKLKDADRSRLLDDREKALVQACEAPGGVRCRVASFYEGSAYRLIKQLEITDVRLVMIPPDSVGNYGDEIDNWQWPRHTGDFAFIRAYVGPDGKPAPYDSKNVPFKPTHHLKTADRGPAPGEFVMVAGYPGGTERWRTAEEVAHAATIDLPKDIEESQWLVDMLADVARTKGAEAAKAVEIPRLYVANGLLNARGTLDGYERGGVVELARQRDAALSTWIAADPVRAAAYTAPLAELRALVASNDATRERDRISYALSRSDLLSAAETIHRFARERAKPDAKRDLGWQDRDVPRIRARMAQMQARLQLDADRRALERYLLQALALPAGQRIAAVDALLGVQPGQPADAAVNAALDRLYATPALATEAARLVWLDRPLAEIDASTDPFLQFARALVPLRDEQRERSRSLSGASARIRPLYVEAMRTFDPARAYPDANGTLRVTYGNLKGYSPRDGVFHVPQTTLAGITAKAGEWPFDAPPSLLAAIAAGTHGPYVDPALSSVPVNFLSDLDITGGNSGSPTLNARGEWVGLAFDGNYEGIASDWFFDPEVARTIHVDVRYVLWYLDVVAKADALVRELGRTPLP